MQLAPRYNEPQARVFCESKCSRNPPVRNIQTTNRLGQSAFRLGNRAYNGAMNGGFGFCHCVTTTTTTNHEVIPNRTTEAFAPTDIPCGACL